MKNKLLFLSIIFFTVYSATIASPILVTIASQSNVTCNGTFNGAATTTVTGNVGTVSYSWSNGQTGANLVNVTAGTYTITVTDAYDATQSAANVTITEPAVLSLNMTRNDVTCFGLNNGSATVTPVGGTAPYNYSWSNSTNNQTASGLVAGTYSVTVVDANGCSSNTNVTIFQNPALTIDAGADLTICAGGSVAMNPTFSGGNGTWTFSWNPPSGLSSTTLFNPSASPTATTGYSVTITDGLGCVASDNIAVNVNAAPIANMGGARTVCGLNVPFTDMSTGTVSSRTWTFGDGGATAPNANPIMTYAVPGSYMVTLTVVGPNSCSSADSAIVVVHETYQVGAPAQNICPGGSYSFNGHTYTAYGYYQDTLVSVYGCDSIVVTNVNVFTAPTVDAGADQTVCQNSTVNLIGTGGVAFNWSGPNNFTSTISNPSFGALLSAGGSYELIGTDANGCSDTDAVNITVLQFPSLAGSVNFLGAAVNGGNVNAYTVTSGVFALAATSTINGSGSFVFNNLIPADYIVSAELDTTSYTRAITTYDTSSVTWNAAVINTLTCGNTANTFINVIQTPALSGSGVISGQIFGGNGPLKTWQQGDPIPGVDVSLEQNPGSVMLAQTQTDAAGAYSFVNVPVGNYAIYVDVPGLGMSATYDVNITSGNNTFSDAMFYVDSMGTIDTVRTIILGNKGVSMYSNNVSIYPNPYNTYTNINYELSEKAAVNIEAYSVLGEKVATLVNTTKEAGKYNERFSAKNFGAGAGIYFVRININNKTQTVRLVETH